MELGTQKSCEQEVVYPHPLTGTVSKREGGGGGGWRWGTSINGDANDPERIYYRY